MILPVMSMNTFPSSSLRAVSIALLGMVNLVQALLWTCLHVFRVVESYPPCSFLLVYHEFSAEVNCYVSQGPWTYISSFNFSDRFGLSIVWS